MLGSYFSPAQQLALGAATVIMLAALLAEWKGRSRWSIALLTTAALVLRVFSATLDPFLNQWDECFHALVAKRMVDDPFTPVLYVKGVLPTSSASWTQAHLWLHKPPFFLWQISCSLGVFGLEPWAVRIPSVLWLTALVPVTYRMGCLLFDERAGWIAALLTTSSYYMLELTAGAITTDHNDAVFIATVSCSCWALLELWNNGARRWALLVGFFSACAILTKVYVGGVVFLPWFAMAVLRRSRKDWMDLLLGAGVAMVLSGLWFGSLAFRFPEALVAQFAFDSGHLGGVVEGHTGGAGYHFRVIDELMFPFTWWLVVPSYAALLLRSKRKEHRVFLGLLFIAVHAVFAWAETKMPSFTLVLVPLYLIAVGTSLVLVTETLIVERYRKWVIGLVPVLLAVPFLELEVLQYRHTLASPPKQHQQWRQQQMEAIPVLANLEGMIAHPANSVVYNVPALHHIQFMFNTGIEATDQMPEAADVARLRNLGYTVYAVQDGEPLDRFTNGVEVIRDEVLRFPDVGRPR